MTQDRDIAELTRLRDQVNAEAAAVPEEPEIIVQGREQLAALQQRLAATSDLMQRYRIEQEIAGVHQSLISELREYEKRRREHREAMDHAQKHLQRTVTERYHRRARETMERVAALVDEAAQAVTTLEQDRTLFEEQFMLRGANGFTNQRLARLLEDAGNVASTSKPGADERRAAQQ